jgi:hypothetical protein
MNRIQKISNNLLIVFNALLVIVPFFAVTPWLFSNFGFVKYLQATGFLQMHINTPEGSVYLPMLHGNWVSTLVGLTGAILGTLPLFLSLFVLKRLFRHYQQGEIFSVRNAKQYKYLGWLFFWDALLAQPVGEGLKVVAATLPHPGHTYLTLNLGGPSVQAVFCGIIMIVISWVMLEASKLHDEQKLII